MKFIWSIAPARSLEVAALAQTMGIPTLLAQCLLNRNLADSTCAANFLEPRLKALADPFLLPNMTAAVDRLLVAREKREPLVIFGDYDVDGVTSTALLLEVLTKLGWTVHTYLPHRRDEGYGLSQEAVETCLRKYPVHLLLAVDCGSTNTETIAGLAARGVDVIVLDHHQVAAVPPAARALVNPQLSRGPADQAIPFVELCSVGLAFKLAHALLKRGRDLNLPGAADFDLRPLLDLVALGTIADVVPLTGENRILVSAGLERLRTTSRPGLVALKQVAQCDEVPGVHAVGFQLAPRLNAAGRLETAEESLHLLMARSLGDALPIAQSLDARNRERQQIERGIVSEVIRAVTTRFQPEQDFVIVEGDLRWHIGVVGIVASRLVQQFYRPAIVVGGEGEHWRGSGRSVAGFDLAAALRECSGLLVRHGGHAMAAGITIEPARIDAFRSRFNEVARNALKAEELRPRLRLDAEVGLEEITLDSLAALERLNPMGQGNPTAQFCARDLSLDGPVQRIGAARQHVKMRVKRGRWTHEAVWWSAAGEELPSGLFDLAFVPQVNTYNGRTAVQLRVLDWRPGAAAPVSAAAQLVS